MEVYVVTNVNAVEWDEVGSTTRSAKRLMPCLRRAGPFSVVRWIRPRNSRESAKCPPSGKQAFAGNIPARVFGSVLVTIGDEKLAE